MVNNGGVYVEKVIESSELIMKSESSQQEEQLNKNNNIFSLDSQTDWKRVEAMQDEDIDLSDMPELTEEALKRAKPFRQFLRERGIEYDAATPTTLVAYHGDGSCSTHQLAPAGNISLTNP